MASVDEDEAEEEPLLKYQRVSLSVSLDDTLRASCIHVTERCIILGTFEGVLLILSTDGNLIRRYQQHRDKITSISCDDTGEVIASSSTDGKVMVYKGQEKPWVRNFYHPVLSVAVDPGYASKREKIFVSGGVAGKLLMNKKGWFSSQETELHRGEGAVTSIKWRKQYIAWSNDVGVKIYNANKGQRIAYIDRPKRVDQQTIGKCCMVWEDDATLIIGWSDSIKIAKVSQRSKDYLMSNPTALKEYAEVILWYETDFLICGVAPCGSEKLALLAYEEEKNENGDVSTRPQLRVISRGTGEELSSDSLPIKGFQRNQAGDYAMASVSAIVNDTTSAQNKTTAPEDTTTASLSADEVLPSIYVLAPKDLVVARARTMEDHIAWALEMNQYELALTMAQEAKDTTYNISDLADKLLSYLMEEGNFDKMAQLCPRLIDTDLNRWVYWVEQLKKRRQLSAIAGYVPVRNPQLPASVYSAILSEMLAQQQDELFVKILRQWQRLLYNHSRAQLYMVGDPSDEALLHPNASLHLFDVHTVTTKVKMALQQRPESLALQDGLAELFCAEGHYDLALEAYLSQPEPSRNAGHIYNMIRRHGLETTLQHKALSLIQLDVSEGVDLLVRSLEDLDDNGATFSKQLGLIVEQLIQEEEHLLQFLHVLYLKRTAEYNTIANSDIQDLQASLYTKYKPDDLDQFLATCSFYSLELALVACRAREPPLYKNMVFILLRMGGHRNAQEALLIVLQHLGDVEQAIELVELQQDESLWNDLIQHTIQHQELISGLLRHVGSHNVNPSVLVKQIPDDLAIAGLKESLVKVFNDVYLQYSLRETASTVVKTDVLTCYNELIQKRARGVKVVCRGTRHDLKVYRSGKVKIMGDE